MRSEGVALPVVGVVTEGLGACQDRPQLEVSGGDYVLVGELVAGDAVGRGLLDGAEDTGAGLAAESQPDPQPGPTQAPQAPPA